MTDATLQVQIDGDASHGTHLTAAGRITQAYTAAASVLARAASARAVEDQASLIAIAEHQRLLADSIWNAHSAGFRFIPEEGPNHG